jgi:hypothetical protein
MSKGDLICTARLHSAVTYSFREEGRSHSGWALCTVNDETCELTITSDHGRWSHRWHKSGFEGTFTSFLSDIDGADYLAGKLCHGDSRSFSAYETVKRIRQRLCQQRLEDCREMRARKLESPEDLRWMHNREEYDDFGLPLYAKREAANGDWRQKVYLLTKHKARRIWAKLGTFDGHSDGDRFLDEYRSWIERDDIADYLPGFDDGVFYCMTSVPSVEWKYLHDRLLPALIAALREDIAKRAE